jgi:hypothetical protein
VNKDREIAAQTKMLENLHKDVEAMKQKLAIPSSLERYANYQNKENARNLRRKKSEGHQFAKANQIVAKGTKEK